MNHCVVLLACLATVAGTEVEQKIEGWQGLRVIRQEGAPERMIAADLDGRGNHELVVVNSRQARLELYRWLPKNDRKESLPTDPDRPNELPMAPEWSRTELPLDDLPVDVVAHDVDRDGRLELLVLTTPSNKLLMYKHNGGEQREWTKQGQWDMLPGTPAGRGPLMFVHALSKGKHELLLSCDQGIQTLLLEPNSRPSWLTPRESRGRNDWRLADLDGDGDEDLVEWSQQARQTVRWYEAKGDNLLPAQVLHDRTVQGFGVLERASKPAELVLLDATQEGLLRRYRLARGEETQIGRQDALPMPGGAAAVWCGIKLDGKPALVAVDSAQPRLRVHELSEGGWLDEQSYPTIGNVRALAAPDAKPGTLLLWVKDASDLHISRWEAGRLTYPQTMPQSADIQDRRILALETVGTTTWWAQRVGEHLDLYVWGPGQKEPQVTRFEGLGTKVEKVVWLGGQRALVQLAYANGAKLVVRDGNTTRVTEPSHLSKVTMSEFAVLPVGNELRPGRYVDGVLQWLGDDLQPVDQIMLPDGQRLASYVPLPKNEAWVLEQGGVRLHQLKPDDAGIPRVAESYKPPTGAALRSDPILGLLLIDQDRVVRLSRGQAWELQLVDSIDSRVGRPSGVKEATIHRILVTDITGDGTDDVLLCDDRRHQLTAVTPTEGELKPLISWQVFDDKTYPYGDQTEARSAEPRMAVGLDADGDSRQDLIMLCHDRLLIYMAREND